MLLALVHRAAGLPGVAFATVLLLGFISALLFRLNRSVSGNDILAFGFTLLALGGSTMHWLARPHLFSWLFTLLFAHAILVAERGDRRPLFWLPLLMLAWTNLHGGFFVGIVLPLSSALGAVVEASMRNEKFLANAWLRAKPYLLCALACGAVTFINPYGWRLHEHVVSYLLDSQLLDGISEYQSLNFRQPGAIVFELMLLLGVASGLWCLRRGKYAAALIVFLWAHLALISVRNFPIFFLLAAPWMTAMSQDVLHRARLLPLLRGRAGSLSAIVRDFKPFERVERWHVASAAVVMLLAYAFAAEKPGFEGRFSPQIFPVSALPALRAAQPARLFTTDEWADYLLYRYFPSQRVFMDDRSDFYGADFLTKYRHILGAQPDWEDTLQEFEIDAVLIDPHVPLAAVLKESAHWKILTDDGSFILFEKVDIRQEQEVARLPGGTVAASSHQEASNILGAPQRTILVSVPKLHERRSL